MLCRAHAQALFDRIVKISDGDARHAINDCNRGLLLQPDREDLGRPRIPQLRIVHVIQLTFQHPGGLSRLRHRRRPVEAILQHLCDIYRVPNSGFPETACLHGS